MKFDIRNVREVTKQDFFLPRAAKLKMDILFPENIQAHILILGKNNEEWFVSSFHRSNGYTLQKDITQQYSDFVFSTEGLEQILNHPNVRLHTIF